LAPGVEHPDRGLTVAVVGASGNTGRQIAIALASKKKTFSGIGEMTLQFVGRRDGESMGNLIGLCSELRDAYQACPHLEVVPDLESVRADVVIMAAGASLSKKFKTYPELIRVNFPVFDEYAHKLVEKNKDAMVIIVSNPMEFGVNVFIEAGFDPRRVLGSGAFFDSLRFRREIASELNIPRQHVAGLTLGKHGLAQVPCWSTVRLAGFARGEDRMLRLAAMREKGLQGMPSFSEVRSLAHKIRDFAVTGEVLKATGMVNHQTSDLRAALRKYVSYFAGPMYPRVGLAEAVSALVVDILNGRERVAAAQVMVQGEFLNIHGVIGAPIIIGSSGVKVAPIDLANEEQEAILKAAKEVQELQSTVQTLQGLRQLLIKKKEKLQNKGKPTYVGPAINGREVSLSIARA